MKKTVSLSLIALIGMLWINLGLGQEVIDDNTLRHNVLALDAGMATRDTIEYAKDHQRADLLVLAIDHRYWAVRTEALDALVTLPADKVRAAVAAILKKPAVWSVDIRRYGGDNAIAGEHFVQTLQKAIKQSYGVDADGYNLFDPAQRASLLTRLK